MPFNLQVLLLRRLDELQSPRQGFRAPSGSFLAQKGGFGYGD